MNKSTTDTPRTDALHSLKVNFVTRIELANDENESIQIKITDSIGSLMRDPNSQSAYLAKAFLENHYPHGFTMQPNSSVLAIYKSVDKGWGKDGGVKSEEKAKCQTVMVKGIKRTFVVPYARCRAGKKSGMNE